jgi:hypothetical protein
MDQAARQRWVGVALLAGVVYALVGIVFAWPTTHVPMWRLAAWLVSGAVFAAHIGYERFALAIPPHRAAVHVALAAALGAFGLAVGALMHSLSSGSPAGHRRLILIALVAWPLITGLPAFVVALGLSQVLTRLSRRTPAR